MTNRLSIHDRDTLLHLVLERDAARERFFRHTDPGGLRPAEVHAWVLEHEAYELLLKAAQVRLDAENEMQELLSREQYV